MVKYIVHLAVYLNHGEAAPTVAMVCTIKEGMHFKQKTHITLPSFNNISAQKLMDFFFRFGIGNLQKKKAGRSDQFCQAVKDHVED